MKTMFRISVLVTLLTTAVAASNVIGPDAAGYTATDETSYSFVDIAATGVRTLALTDDGTTTTSIGFAFTLYGTSYSEVCISANGYLLFGGCTDAFLNQDLAGAATPGNRPMVAPFWSDLSFLWPTADAVYYETLGTAPTRQFVVQWNRAFPQNASQPVTVQAILYEADHTVRFQYHSVNAGAGHPASNGGQATVAVCDTDGAATGRCLQWSYNSAILQDETAILIDPNSDPPVPAMPGRMHGNGFIVQNGVRYQFNFDVREDATGHDLGTFRLNVENRGKPQRFTSHAVTSAVFSDDPNVRPQPRRGPPADTVVFNGVGDWNGAADHRFEVSARDEGEGRQHRESIRITITSPSGAVLVSAEGVLGGGNLQSTRMRH
jgi:hypothetical protein